MNETKKLHKDILLSCDDDYTGLWEIIRDVQRYFGKIESKEIQVKALVAIRELLEFEFIQAGFPIRGGKFEPWMLSANEVIDQIKTEWNLLDHEPTIGEVVWFTITTKGRQRLSEL